MSPKEQKEQKDLKSKLLKHFPGGIAEVIAIKERRGPDSVMIEGRPQEKDLYRIRATEVEIRVMKNTGVTHEITGASMIKPHVMKMGIWPISGRTDRFDEGKPYFKKPIDLLLYLADPAVGWGKIFRLLPVAQEQIDIEESAMQDPVSRQLFEDLRRSDANGMQLVPGDKVAAATLAKETKQKYVETVEEEFEEQYDTDDPEEMAGRAIERDLMTA